MSSKYVIEAIDLSRTNDRTPIASTLANRVATVVPVVLPAAMALHFGQGGQAWPIVQGKKYKPCPPETDGIFVSNVAASGICLLAITFADGEIDVEGNSEAAEALGLIAYGRASQGGSVNSGPAVQLYNPAGSGKIITVVRVSVMSGSNTNIYLALHRNQIGNNGGGVLTNGSKRFLDRSLAPAIPIGVSDDAGIVGLIRGTTFDNNLWTEFGLAPGAAAQFPPTSAFMMVLGGGNIQVPGELLRSGEKVRLYPGWGCTVQHSTLGAGVVMNAVFVASEGGV